MKLDPAHTAKILKQLRKTYNTTDAFYTEPGRSREFSEQVKSDVEEIARQNLHKDITGWGKRCFDARVRNGFTLSEAADLLGVSIRTIQNQEKKNGSTTVDLFYLEAFSLIYHENPYSLIDKKLPHLISPLQSISPRVLQSRNIIMGSLYDENDSKKLSYLETIMQIARLTSPKFLILTSFLENTKTFHGITKPKPINHPKADDSSWYRKGIKPVLQADQCDSEEYWRRKVYWEASTILDYIDRHFPERLDVLLNLAVLDDKAAEHLVDIIKNIGFPKDHKSLRIYNYDEMIIEPAPGTKNRATGRGSYRHNESRTSGEENMPTSPVEDGVSPISVQNDISLTDDTCRKQNQALPQVFMYCPDTQPDYHPSTPFKKITPGNAVALIYGDAEELTDFLLNLHYSPESTNAAPLTPEVTLSIEYRIALNDCRVDSRLGRAKLTKKQVAALSKIIDRIETVQPSPDPPAPGKESS